MLVFHIKLELPLASLISIMDMDYHLYRANNMLEPLRLAESQTANVRKSTGVLLLYICSATSRDLHTFVTRWTKKTISCINNLRERFAIYDTHTIQARFPEIQPK